MQTPISIIEYRYWIPQIQGKIRAVFITGEKAERYSIPVFSTGKNQSSTQYRSSTGKNQSGIEYRYSIPRFFSSGIRCAVSKYHLFLRIKYNFILPRKVYFYLHWRHYISLLMPSSNITRVHANVFL
jgi:hypothetical protein